MKVRLEPAGKLVKFSLAKGDARRFRRVIAAYAAPRPGHAYFVPLSAALACCTALGKAGAALFADGAVQASLRPAAWRCDLSGLYPFQKVGAEFLRTRRRAILADEMGVGKSAQALAGLDANKAALVISPPVVTGAWYNEARRWRPDLQSSLWKRPYSVFPGAGELVITSYSSLPYEWVEPRTRCPFCERLAVVSLESEADATGTKIELPSGGEMQQSAVPMEETVTAVMAEDAMTRQRWTHRCDRDRGGCGRKFDQRSDAFVEHVWAGPRPSVPVQLVVDEAHYIKGRKAKRTTAVRAIASACESVWLLTGTPLLNTPEELWSLCQAFPGPGPFDSGAFDAFGSWGEFVRLFHGKKKEPYGGYEWSSAGEVEPEAIERLGSLMLRRMRAEVLPELPPKTRRFLEVRYDPKGIPAWGPEISDMGDDEVLAACAPEGSLSTVRMMLADRKLPALLDLLVDYEEAREPVIVFSYHRGPVVKLGERSGWACITGSTSDRDRASLIAAFQEGKLKGLAGTIGAMGVGATLTRSSNVIFLDRDFVPANNLQGEDRAMRIGQLRAVTITILVTSHPVDLRVRDVLIRKERLLESMQLSGGPAVAAN